LVYPLHIIEEIRGVGVLHGINLSLTKFFVFSSAGLLLMVIGIFLAQRFRFPQFLGTFLGTLFVVNGLSHITNSVVIAGYDRGLITGIVFLIPLGLMTLIRAWNGMRRLRYFAAVVMGLAVHGVISIIAL
jgi:hypothetical protein